VMCECSSRKNEKQVAGLEQVCRRSVGDVSRALPCSCVLGEFIRFDDSTG